MKIECIIEYARKLFDSMTIMLLVAIDDGVIVDIDEIVVTVGKAKIIEENVLLDVVDTGESREGVQDDREAITVCDEDWLNVDDPGELLDPVEEGVTLLDAGLVLGVFAVRSVRHHNTSNLQICSYNILIKKKENFYIF